MDPSSPLFPMVKRLVAFVVGFAVIALNKKLGLNLSEVDTAALTTLILGFITQSAMHEVAIAKANTTVKTTDDAVAVLSAPPKGFAKLKMLLVLMMICLVPMAALAADVPVASLDVSKISVGTPAPADGCFLDENACQVTAKRVVACEDERDSLRKATPPWLIVVVAAVVGAGVGVGGTLLLKK